MNTVAHAVANIPSPSFKDVLSGLYDPDSNSSVGENLNTSKVVGGFGGSHFHQLRVTKEDVPTHAWVAAFALAIQSFGKAACEELDCLRANIANIGTAVSESSGLIEAFKKTYDALVAEMVAEQSSHRRFEQLVQTLGAKVREVRAIYDTIDDAIKKATEDASSGVIKQIDDKGKSVVADMEQEVKRRIEDVLKVVFSKAREDMSKVAGEKTKSVQDDLMEMGQKFECAVDARMQSVESDMKKQLEALSRRGNELVSRLGGMSLEINKRVVEIENRLNDMISAAEKKLTMDVRSEVPALFRGNGGCSSFLKRLKWLFFGRV